jgi:ribosomal protein S18 acetylase RimI-like enzyme
MLQDTPEFKLPEVAVAEEVIDSYLNDPQSYRVLVAEDDAGIAGYVCYGLTPLTESTWDIYWLAVSRQRRGRGIGSALMTAAEGGIKKARGRLVIIETSAKPEYEKTRQFYCRHNYDFVCQIADFYAPGDDKIILQKRLEPDK